MVRAIANAVEAYYLETGSFTPYKDDYSIPAELNVSAPKSKYYTYEYENIIPWVGIMSGACLVQVGARPMGEFSSYDEFVQKGYSIWYMYDTPTISYNNLTGQQINEHWYRCYNKTFYEIHGGP